MLLGTPSLCTKSSEEGVLISQAEVVLDVVVNVSSNAAVGSFVIALEGDEIIALLVMNLLDYGFLASHGVDRHDTALDGQELQEFRNGGVLIGLAVRPRIESGAGFELTHDEAAVLRAPGGYHMDGGQLGGPVKGRADGFAIERDGSALGELGDRLGP